MLTHRAARAVLISFVAILTTVPGLGVGGYAATVIKTQQSGRVEGTVVDPTGARIADARVILQNVTGDVIAETSTDKEGRFEFKEVAQGHYEVIVELTGFSQAERPA